ncbi:MAG: flagellar motor switch protein FliN [Planctomycetaceae bacterium]
MSTQDAEVTEAPTPEPARAEGRPVSTRPIAFPAVSGEQPRNGQVPLTRFYDMTVAISVELGRVEIPLGELLRLGEGSVLELDRGVEEPVDILAQGVPLARGDVVAANGRYAVRITEIVAGDAASAMNSPLNTSRGRD